MRSRFHLHLTVPGVYIALALVLGLLVPELGWKLLSSVPLARVAPESAIGMLSAIASGMMALTGVGFSIAFVFFQLSSSAYTPRLLAEFARNQVLRHALGVFSGTFLYAALAIRAVNIAGRPHLHPLVTWIALLWLLASAVMLVLVTARIDRLSMAKVLALLGERGLEQLRALYLPYRQGSSGETDAAALALEAAPATQLITHAGASLYLVRIDEQRLRAAARASGGMIFIPHAIGDAVINGDALAMTRGAERDVPEQLVREAVVLQRDRTIDGHPEYALRLLVDIAIRALSPAVNDPSTAVGALDQIEGLLRAFAGADFERGVVRDAQSVVRVVYLQPSFEDVLSLALTEIAQYGAESVQVQRRLGALLADLAERVPEPRRAAVERLLARRERALEHAAISSEAACCDRQGLGHTLPRS